jgi:hypothetical protein
VPSEQIIESDVVERERPWLRPVGLASIAAAVLVMGSLIAIRGTLSGDTDQVRLVQIHSHTAKLVVSSALGGVGFALLAAPLLLLFRAAQARSDRVKPGLRWLLLIGPVFLAVASVVHTAALEHVASRFLELRGRAAGSDERLADTLIRDSGIFKVATGLGIAGSLGVAVGAFYTSLWGLRTGLLRRFLGTFGMAVAVVFVLIPFGVLLWSLAVGAMLLGLGGRGLPEAWTAGAAIPWPQLGKAE